MINKSGTLVIGIGNEYRGDDAVGLYVARKLSGFRLQSCAIKESPGEGTYLMHSWEGFEHVIIIDAVKSASKPGTIHRIDIPRQEIPSDWFPASSHLISLPEAIKLSQALGTLPASLVVYGIEGNLFDTGVKLTPPVKEAADSLIAALLNDISSRKENGRPTPC
ncbi:MAG: hydrogenase maturation protease [Candidatus Zixiibacteriota bacterium]